MGKGLQRVAKECGGLTVEAKGETVTYDANGKVIAVKRTCAARLEYEAANEKLSDPSPRGFGSANG